VTAKAIGAKDSSESALRSRVRELAKFPSASEEQRIMAGLGWIGLFDAQATVTARGNLLDSLCATLEAKMQYEHGERDMVMLVRPVLLIRTDTSATQVLRRERRRQQVDPHLDPARLWRAHRLGRLLEHGQARRRPVRHLGPAHPRRQDRQAGHPCAGTIGSAGSC